MKIVLNRVIFYDILRILKSKKIEILFHQTIRHSNNKPPDTTHPPPE